MPEELPLLKEIAALKQNSDRSWDERTRKEMEFAAPKIGQDHFPAGSERAQHKMSGRALVARAGPQTTCASRIQTKRSPGIRSSGLGLLRLPGAGRPHEGQEVDEVWRSHDRHRPGLERLRASATVRRLAGRTRVAVSFVLNYEEGGERNVARWRRPSRELSGAGDRRPAGDPARSRNVEDLFEYGSRAGFWRVLRPIRRASAAFHLLGGRDWR